MALLSHFLGGASTEATVGEGNTISLKWAPTDSDRLLGPKASAKDILEKHFSFMAKSFPLRF